MFEIWINRYLAEKKFVPWHEFGMDLGARFKDDNKLNVVEQFKSLNQKDSLEDNIDKFDELRV